MGPSHLFKLLIFLRCAPRLRKSWIRASLTDDMVLYVSPNFIFLWPCEVSMILNPFYKWRNLRLREGQIANKYQREGWSSVFLPSFHALSPRDCCTRFFHVGLSLPPPHFYWTLPGVELFPHLASVMFRLWSAYTGPRMLIWKAFAVDNTAQGKPGRYIVFSTALA